MRAAPADSRSQLHHESGGGLHHATPHLYSDHGIESRRKRSPAIAAEGIILI
jgi:hypothetical protein